MSRTGRRVFPLLVAAVMVLGAVPAVAQKQDPGPDPALVEITGIEWMQESLGRRMDALLLSMAALQKSGVPLKRTPDQYYKEMHVLLRSHPEEYNSLLTDILARHIYGREPAARKALDALRGPAVPAKA